MDSTTLKFEQALPFALLPVSPQLAALHATRTRSLPLPYSCSRCGSELTMNTRVKRSKCDARPLRSISAACHACGAVSSIRIGPGKATNIPSWKKGNLQVQLPEPITQTQGQVTPLSFNIERLASSLPVSKPSAEIRSVQDVRLTSKLKKKTRLQEMLQRNRDEKKRTQTEESKQAGLSAFLSTL